MDRIHRDRTRAGGALEKDFSDAAIQQENDEVLDRLDTATEADLKQVEQALNRLERGLYGLCETCGFPIETERLQALPHAIRCASCADRSSTRVA